MRIVLLLLALLFCFGLSCRQTSIELKRISVQHESELRHYSAAMQPTTDAGAPLG